MADDGAAELSATGPAPFSTDAPNGGDSATREAEAVRGTVGAAAMLIVACGSARPVPAFSPNFGPLQLNGSGSPNGGVLAAGAAIGSIRGASKPARPGTTEPRSPSLADGLATSNSAFAGIVPGAAPVPGRLRRSSSKLRGASVERADAVVLARSSGLAAKAVPNADPNDGDDAGAAVVGAAGVGAGAGLANSRDPAAIAAVAGADGAAEAPAGDSDGRSGEAGASSSRSARSSSGVASAAAGSLVATLAGAGTDAGAVESPLNARAKLLAVSGAADGSACGVAAGRGCAD